MIKNSTPLSAWLKKPGNTRTLLAKQTHFTYDGITKMLKPHRDVYVVVNGKKIELFESKKLIAKKHSAALASSKATDEAA